VYDNDGPSGRRTWKINPAQAEVVRDIYTRFAAGQGIRTIVASLNERGVPAPRAQQNRPNGWSASTIRAVLERPLYRGEVVWGRMKNAYDRELPDASREEG
jgi:lambda repressor-like predicted transcriptional regulator